MHTIVIIDQADLLAFAHSCLDLQTMQINELSDETVPVQLELPFDADEGTRGDHNAKVAHCRNHLT